MAKPFRRFKQKAFTLVELLIAMAILGVIASFTIPKVLTTQNTSQKNAVAKEAAAALAGAYQAYKQDHGDNPNMAPAALLPYLNYVKVYSNNDYEIDNNPGNDKLICAAWGYCAVLHNGGVFYLGTADSFGGTSSTNMNLIHFDPDGKYDNAGTQGPGKAVVFSLYYNGRITTQANVTPGSRTALFNPVNPDPSADPSWLSW